jgi:hypothetical protein
MVMAKSLEKFCKHESDENLSAAISSINKEVEFLKTVDFKKAVSTEYIDEERLYEWVHPTEYIDMA